MTGAGLGEHAGGCWTSLPSLLYDEQGPRLAPIYAISTVLYAEVDERLAITVADAVSVHEVTAKDLSEEASSWGMPPRREQQRIAGLLDRMTGAIGAMSKSRTALRSP